MHRRRSNGGLTEHYTGHGHMLHHLFKQYPHILENQNRPQKDVRNILKATEQSGMKIKTGKCEFHVTETEYLGFIIAREGIKVDPVKTSLCHMGMGQTDKCQGDTKIYRVLQLLSKIH